MKRALGALLLLSLSCTGGVVDSGAGREISESDIPPGTYSGEMRIIDRSFLDSRLQRENKATLIDQIHIDARGIPVLAGTTPLQIGQTYSVREAYFAGTATPTAVEVAGPMVTTLAEITFADTNGATWTGWDSLTVTHQPPDGLNVARRISASAGDRASIVVVQANLVRKSDAQAPTPTPAASASPEPSATATPMPTATPSPTPSPQPTPPAPTPEPTPAASNGFAGFWRITLEANTDGAEEVIACIAADDESILGFYEDCGAQNSLPEPAAVSYNDSGPRFSLYWPQFGSEVTFLLEQLTARFHEVDVVDGSDIHFAGYAERL